MARKSVTKMELIGAKELEASLRALGKDRLIRSTLKRAVIDALEIVVPVAKALAPARKRGGGRLKSKIGVSTRLSPSQRRHKKRDAKTEATAYVGAGPGPAHLIEFGTGPRYTKVGKYTGQMPARPFMRPAWEQTKGKVLEVFQKALWEQIEKSAKRLAKRQAKLIAQGKRA